MVLLIRWLIRSVVVFIGLISIYLNSFCWVLVVCGIGTFTVIGLSLSLIGDLEGLGVVTGN